MEDPVAGEASSEAQAESPHLCRLIHLCCVVLLFLVTALPVQNSYDSMTTSGLFTRITFAYPPQSTCLAPPDSFTK